ncbi:hypothetical protein BC567DRAFT_44258 [Phyllosticta citribraziliensis]
MPSTSSILTATSRTTLSTPSARLSKTPRRRTAVIQDEPDGRLLQTLFRHDRSIRGTPPCCAAQRFRVEAMAGQIGIPSLFVSFSSGEMHRQSFARLFPDYSEWNGRSLVEWMNMSAVNASRIRTCHCLLRLPLQCPLDPRPQECCMRRFGGESSGSPAEALTLTASSTYRMLHPPMAKCKNPCVTGATSSLQLTQTPRNKTARRPAPFSRDPPKRTRSDGWQT